MSRSFSSRQRRLLASDICLFLGVVALSILLTLAYVGSEDTYYYWDWGRSQHIHSEIAELFQQSPVSALFTVKNSMGSEYNALFALPLLPFTLLLGDSRRAFELAVVLAYQIPFLLAVALTATRLIPSRRRFMFWTSLGIGLLTPMVWIPTLRGYVDAGSASLLALAVYLYLEDPSLKGWRRVLAVGCLIGFSILLRRHFAYGAMDFFASAGVLAFIRFCREKRASTFSGWMRPAADLVNLGLAGLACFLTLAVFGWSFLVLAYKSDYSFLYSSFSFAPTTVLVFYALSYGLFFTAFGLTGYLVALRLQEVNRLALLFFSLFGAYSLLQWAFLVGMNSVNYTLHFTPFLIVGASLVLWFLYSRSRPFLKIASLSLTGLLLLCNLLVALSLPGLPVPLATPLFSPPHPPFLRRDKAEIVRLVNALRERGESRRPIYVAAASRFLNSDLLQRAEQSLYGRAEARLLFLPTQQVDSRDSYPLEGLLQAQLVVIAHPWQRQATPEATMWEYHLPREEQDLVRIACAAFLEKWEISDDFQKWPVRFSLENGAEAEIFERIRSSSSLTALRTLDRMRTALGETPGGQSNWIELSGRRYRQSQNLDGSCEVFFRPQSPEGDHGVSLLYLGHTGVRGHIRATLRTECPGGQFRLRVNSLRLDALEPLAVTAHSRPGPFQISYQMDPPAPLLFQVECAAEDRNWSLHITHLEVVPETSPAPRTLSLQPTTQPPMLR